MDFRAEKRGLRLLTLERILAMDPADRTLQERALAERLPTLPGFAGAHTVLLYASAFPEEIDTGPMLQQCLALGKRLVCPRVDRQAGVLRLHEIRRLQADLAPGAMGIPEPHLSCPRVEPAEVDWMLAPGLAFDERCYRLGRGAGYYDRLLPTLRADTLRFAFALEPQWVIALPVEPHDQQLDAIVSRARSVTSERQKSLAE